MNYKVTCGEQIGLDDSLGMSGTPVSDPYYEIHFVLDTPLDLSNITGIPSNIVFAKRQIDGKEKCVSITLTGTGFLTTEILLDAIQKIALYLDRIMISTGQATEYTVSTTQAKPTPGHGRAALVRTSTKTITIDAVIIKNGAIDLSEETTIGEKLDCEPEKSNAKILTYYAESKRRPESNVKLSNLYKIAEILDPTGSRLTTTRAFRNWIHHKELSKSPKQIAVIVSALGSKYQDYNPSNPVHVKLARNGVAKSYEEIHTDSNLKIKLD